MAAAAASHSDVSPRPSSNPDQQASGSPSPLELSGSPSAAAAQPPLLPPPPASRRLAPPCWGHEETLALIDVYREQWYELRRGNLRASHWQEVADAVRRRGRRLSAAATAKTALQCRHKVEKLRQRYKAEKQRLALRGNASKPRRSSWAYFPHMDAMELGAAPSPSPSSDGEVDGHSNSEDEGIPKSTNMLQRAAFNGDSGGAGLEFRIPKASRSKVIGPNGAAAKPKPSNGFFKGSSGAARPSTAVGEAVKGVAEKKKGGLVWEMVAVVKMLGDEFRRVEEMKMEMVRDVVKLRREMELKRTELIVRSQRQIVDCIKGLHEKKRAKAAPLAMRE